MPALGALPPAFFSLIVLSGPPPGFSSADPLLLSSSPRQEPPATFPLRVEVKDENSVPVPHARVSLLLRGGSRTWNSETDYRGVCVLSALAAGRYRLEVEKKGFYRLARDDLELSEAAVLEVRLEHFQETSEVVDVVYSTPSIDPQETASQEALRGREIVQLPYPTNRDIRNILPFFPGVLQDPGGQLHLNGSDSAQILTQLDGFNVGRPSDGRLELRVSPDAVRAIHVQRSRYSAELGKGSGGVLSFETGMGDDRFRFSATNFIPSFQDRKGLHLNNWTPRLMVSGPLKRGRAWFLNAIDGEYNLDIVPELPDGQDRNRSWRVNNLAKLQVNLTPAQILNAAVLVNRFRADHAGLTRFDPLETTRRLVQEADLLSLRHQARLSGGLLLETGAAFLRHQDDESPLGESPYRLQPRGSGGNFFRRRLQDSRRWQFHFHLTLPEAPWKGRHLFRLGLGVDRLRYRESGRRSPIWVFRQDGTLSRTVRFMEDFAFRRRNWEWSGFVEDRWSLSERGLLELGLRLDRDSILEDWVISPRLAASYLLNRVASKETKLSGGIGIFADATPLDLVSRPQAGPRIDLIYDQTGEEVIRLHRSRFFVQESRLEPPRFLNWSIALKQGLPGSLQVEIEYLRKRGRKGLVFLPSTLPSGNKALTTFELRNARRDRYDAFQVTLQRSSPEDHLFASYTRSAARSNAVLDFQVDEILFAPQAEGPLPWDVPHRFLVWGWTPLLRGFQLAYTVEWRSGFPFSVVNEEQALVEPPHSRRFPSYFSLNLHLDRPFRFLGRRWALRVGVNNLTNHRNAGAVNNNVDAPEFLTFGAIQGRALVARIRWLGAN